MSFVVVRGQLAPQYRDERISECQRQWHITAVRARTFNNMASFSAIYVTRYKPPEYKGSLLSVWFHDFASQTRIYYLKALEQNTQYPDNLREKEGKGTPAMVNRHPDLFEPLQDIPGSLDIDARTDFQLLLVGITGATFKFADMHSNKRTIGSTSQFRGYLCACCLSQQYPTCLLGSFHQALASWTQQRLQGHAICPLNRMKR